MDLMRVSTAYGRIIMHGAVRAADGGGFEAGVAIRRQPQDGVLLETLGKIITRHETRQEAEEQIGRFFPRRCYHYGAEGVGVPSRYRNGRHEVFFAGKGWQEPPARR